MLKLKPQYFGHLMQRASSMKRPWCCERLRVGGGRDGRGWDGWMALSTQWTWVWKNLRDGEGQGKAGMLLFTGLERVGHNWTTEHLQQMSNLVRFYWILWFLDLFPYLATQILVSRHLMPFNNVDIKAFFSLRKIPFQTGPWAPFYFINSVSIWSSVKVLCVCVCKSVSPPKATRSHIQ